MGRDGYVLTRDILQALRDVFMQLPGQGSPWHKMDYGSMPGGVHFRYVTHLVLPFTQKAKGHWPNIQSENEHP